MVLPPALDGPNLFWKDLPCLRNDALCPDCYCCLSPLWMTRKNMGAPLQYFLDAARVGVR